MQFPYPVNNKPNLWFGAQKKGAAMLSREQARNVQRLLETPLGSVVSLYLDINPARSENAGKATVLRVRDALEELRVPKPISARVLQKLQELPKGRTQIVIAGEGLMESWSLQAELPLIGGIEVRWGELYLAPLLYALDEFERFGVVSISADKARLFEVFMGEVEELPGAFQVIDPANWKQFSTDSVGRGYTAGGRMRAAGGADIDHFNHRLEAWSQRFFKRMAHELEEWTEVRGLTRLILIGNKREVEAFAHALPRSLYERIIDKQGGSIPRITPGSVLKKVSAGIEAYEYRREHELVKKVLEGGVSGLDQVLRLLQQGRLQLVLAPWQANQTVYRGPDGEVVCDLELAQQQFPGQAIQAMSLKEVLPELGFAQGTRVAFVRGEAETWLIRLGGMGGLERY